MTDELISTLELKATIDPSKKDWFEPQIGRHGQEVHNAQFFGKFSEEEREGWLKLSDFHFVAIWDTQDSPKFQLRCVSNDDETTFTWLPITVSYLEMWWNGASLPIDNILLEAVKK